MTKEELLRQAHNWAECASDRGSWEDAGLPGDPVRALQWCIFYLWAAENCDE